MTRKEVIDTLKIAKAEVEWNYPLDYAVAIDQAIEYIKAYEYIIVELEKAQTYKLFGNNKDLYLDRQQTLELIKNKLKEIENDVKVGDTVQS
ncbi:MAG: hypothetical protein II453_11515 [Alphaproteobacteria bacterium]|nr:hypothetical protein [Alphaproteobacteria bacterium]